jgi:hypothetical protein
MLTECKISPLHIAAVNHHFALQNALAGFGGLRATFCSGKTGLRAVYTLEKFLKITIIVAKSKLKAEKFGPRWNLVMTSKISLLPLSPNCLGRLMLTKN